jgi:hypothetical protein
MGVERLESAMTTCRICGIEIRDGDDAVTVDDHTVHSACADAPKSAERRQVGSWTAYGSRGQMAIGDVQRNTAL